MYLHGKPLKLQTDNPDLSSHSKMMLVLLHPSRVQHLFSPSLSLTSSSFLLSLFVLAFTCRDAQDFPGLSDDFYGSKSLSKCGSSCQAAVPWANWTGCATHHTHIILSFCFSLFLTESSIYLNSYLLFESTHYLQVATHFSDAFQSETRCLASKMLDLILSIVSIRRWKVVTYQYRARPNVSLLQFGLLYPIICMAYVKTL